MASAGLCLPNSSWVRARFRARKFDLRSGIGEAISAHSPGRPSLLRTGARRGGDSGRITWTYATLRNLLITAYSVESYQISGPDWLGTERYDVTVTLPSGATKEQVNVMWQNLIAERFGVMLHHESKEFQVEELVIAKNGPQAEGINRGSECDTSRRSFRY